MISQAIVAQLYTIISRLSERKYAPLSGMGNRKELFTHIASIWRQYAQAVYGYVAVAVDFIM